MNGLETVLRDLYKIIESRQAEMPEGSYTTYLFQNGQDKILKKVGEECTEVVIASKNNDNQEVVYEVSDLIYHLLVLLVQHGIGLEQVMTELQNREERPSKIQHSK